MLWVALWQILASDCPEVHPRISAKERELILRRRATVSTTGTMSKLPLRSIFTSPAFLSLLVTHVSYGWFLLVIATYLPIYLNDVWLFQTQTNGVLSSLPFVCQLLSSAMFAVLSDHLTSGSLLSVTCSRKLFQSVGLVIPAGVLVVTGWLTPGQHHVAVTLLVIVAPFQSACLSGFNVNHLDIAPRLSGSLSGITGSVATAVCMLIPLLVSPVIADKRQESWRTVFLMTAAVAVTGAIVFAIFGSGEEQEWARRPERANGQKRVSGQDGRRGQDWARGKARAHGAERTDEQRAEEQVQSPLRPSLKVSGTFLDCPHEVEMETNVPEGLGIDEQNEHLMLCLDAVDEADYRQKERRVIGEGGRI